MSGTFQLSRGTHDFQHKHVDEIIEEDVRETNVGTFVEVTDIAQIIRKNIRFWISGSSKSSLAIG